MDMRGGLSGDALSIEWLTLCAQLQRYVDGNRIDYYFVGGLPC
jgi:hypothetical protein